MGCNAWNHPANCSCGWGGVFYENGLRSSDEATHWQRAISFTIPNARCPDCNAPVYFYKSPYGGHVFFDDLGPPWPKHPCTDTGRVGPRSAHGIENKLTRKESGWRPFYCTELYANPRESGGIVLVSQNEFGVTKLFSRFDKKLVDHRTPFFIRRDLANVEAYEITTLNALETYPSEVRFKATTAIPPPTLEKKNKLTRERIAASVAHQHLVDTTNSTAADKIGKIGKDNNSKILKLLLVGSKNERVAFVQERVLTSWQRGRYEPIMKLCQDVFGDATINRIVDGNKIARPEIAFDPSHPTKNCMLAVLSELCPYSGRGDEAEVRVILIIQAILEFEATHELEKAARGQAFDKQMADKALTNLRSQ